MWARLLLETMNDKTYHTFPISEQLTVTQHLIPPLNESSNIHSQFLVTCYCLCEQSRCLAVNQPIRAELIICCWAVVILVWLGCWPWVIVTVRGLATVGSPQPIAQELKHPFLCITTNLNQQKDFTHILQSWIYGYIFLTVLGWLSSTLLHLSSSSGLQLSIYNQTRV